MTMLLGARAIERIGDNAVDIGEQVAFIVTGLFREFEDASHPAAGSLLIWRRMRLRSGASGSMRETPVTLCAAIDIGSNTTRVLVAEPIDGQLKKVMEQRAYTRINKALDSGGAILAEKIEEVQRSSRLRCGWLASSVPRDPGRGDGGRARRRNGEEAAAAVGERLGSRSRSSATRRRGASPSSAQPRPLGTPSPARWASSTSAVDRPR